MRLYRESGFDELFPFTKRSCLVWWKLLIVVGDIVEHLKRGIND